MFLIDEYVLNERTKPIFFASASLYLTPKSGIVRVHIYHFVVAPLSEFNNVFGLLLKEVSSAFLYPQEHIVGIIIPKREILFDFEVLRDILEVIITHQKCNCEVKH